jgi:hypothetical protein
MVVRRIASTKVTLPNDLAMRVEALERAVFGPELKRKVVKGDFKGATGGLRLLLSKASLIVVDVLQKLKRR